MINMYADLRGITNVMGSYNALIEDFSNNRNLATLSGLAAEAANQSFNEYMDAMSEGNPNKFGHMYDWGELGEASGRLWRAILGEAGQVSILTFDFIQSVNEVPVGSDASGAEDDTRTGGHVFREKAEVVEQGKRVHIRPLNPGGWLAIPTGEQSPKGKRPNVSKGGGMWFTQGAVVPPVNMEAVGAFTEAWTIHFETVAVKVVDEIVTKRVERYFNDYEDIVREFPRHTPPAPSAIRRSHADVLDTMGEKIGRRKNGQFMNAAEKEQQLIRAERFRETTIT